MNTQHGSLVPITIDNHTNIESLLKANLGSIFMGTGVSP